MLSNRWDHELDLQLGLQQALIWKHFCFAFFGAPMLRNRLEYELGSTCKVGVLFVFVYA